MSNADLYNPFFDKNVESFNQEAMWSTVLQKFDVFSMRHDILHALLYADALSFLDFNRFFKDREMEVYGVGNFAFYNQDLHPRSLSFDVVKTAAFLSYLYDDCEEELFNGFNSKHKLMREDIEQKDITRYEEQTLHCINTPSSFVLCVRCLDQLVSGFPLDMRAKISYPSNYFRKTVEKFLSNFYNSLAKDSELTSKGGNYYATLANTFLLNPILGREFIARNVNRLHRLNEMVEVVPSTDEEPFVWLEYLTNAASLKILTSDQAFWIKGRPYITNNENQLFIDSVL